ncbi:MAG: preprotein translocase subunit SecE [Solirubrobacteraceae bacterium]
MARKRQRARDRKRKQHSDDDAPAPLDHASGEVELAEAAMASGGVRDDEEPVGEPVELEKDFDAAAVDDARRGRPSGEGAAAAKKPSGWRLLNFLRASAAELQRVEWPNRRQTGQATAVVLGFVVIAGSFLGLADVIAQKIVDFIL